MKNAKSLLALRKKRKMNALHENKNILSISQSKIHRQYLMQKAHSSPLHANSSSPISEHPPQKKQKLDPFADSRYSLHGSNRLSEPSIRAISTFVKKNSQSLLPQQYLRPSESGLERSIHISSTGTVFVHLNRLKLGDYLVGTGSAKKVKLAFDLANGTLFASASILCDGSDLDTKNFNHEILMLKFFKNVPGFVQMVDTVSYLYLDHQLGNTVPPGERRNMKAVNLCITKQRIIFELANGGNLHEYVHSTSLAIQQKKCIFEGLVQSVAYMHKNNIIHKDLKITNIFIHTKADGSISPIIGDLGAASRIDDRERQQYLKSTYTIVSPEYAKIALPFYQAQNFNTFYYPPIEAVNTPALDMWSLGCVLLFLLGKSLPWRTETNSIVCLAQISALKKTWIKAPGPNTPSYLIWEMLQVAPENRISAEQAEAKLEHLTWPS